MKLSLKQVLQMKINPANYTIKKLPRIDHNYQPIRCKLFRILARRSPVMRLLELGRIFLSFFPTCQRAFHAVACLQIAQLSTTLAWFNFNPHATGQVTQREKSFPESQLLQKKFFETNQHANRSSSTQTRGPQ